MTTFLKAITISLLFAAAGVQAQTNLALGKPATQSSDIDNVKGKASLAVDGNTDGDWNHGSVTHTVDGGSADPWWQVDLGATYTIQKVVIWNRTDCCGDRLGSLRVLIGSTAHGPWNWFTEEGSVFFSDGARAMSMSGAKSGRKDGRFIRIQLLGSKAILSLAEVQVIGVPVAAPVVAPLVNVDYERNLGTNVAEGKAATQSSDASLEAGQAFKAIDGNTDGNWSNGSVTHTASKGSDQPWWQVDLGGQYRIRAVQIFNRTDCCWERLNSVRVLIGSSIAEGLGVFAASSDGPVLQNPVTYKNDMTGRYVRVQLQGSKTILSLAEVRVFGELIPEIVAVVPEPTPEPVPTPRPAPEPCPAPPPRPSWIWNTTTCEWVRESRQPNPDPIPAPGPEVAPPTTAPFVRMPRDNMMYNVIPRRVSFQWDAVGGTSAYAMEIEVLVSGEWRLWEAPTIRDLSAERTFEGDGSYRWHVAATGSNGSAGPYSTWRSFRINTLGPPAPTLRAPADGVEWNCNGITPNCGHPTFLWNAADRAQRYIVTIDVFEKGSWRNHTTQATTGLQLEVNNFPTGVPARWSVQAIGENDVGGGTSLVRTFQVHWKPF